MSDHEFDAYLALLTRFLHLSGRQRDDIRRELRAHLEEALDEYLAQGLTHHDAVLRALEDFGDAAELAARFRAIGRTRRWIMRGTATAAGIGIMAVTTSFFMSSRATPVQAGFKPAAMMQAEGVRTGVSVDHSPPDAGTPDANAAVLNALRKPIPEVSLENTPFNVAVDFIAEFTGANVVVEWGALEENGIDRDRSVNLKLKNVSAERVLSIVLSDVGRGAAALSSQVKDGILFISTTESFKRELVVQVYDCRDLLTAGLDWQKAKERLAPGALRHAETVPANPPPTAPAADSRTAPPPPAGVAKAGGAPEATCAEGEESRLNWPESALVDVVMHTVDPDAWQPNGGTGTATIFGGVLIVRQYPTAHREVERLLSMLRDAGLAEAAGSGVASR